MKNIDKQYDWSDWKKFPDPRKKEYLHAPIGYGVYQLRLKNEENHEFILFGKGNNLALRMSSLLIKTLGGPTGGRDNNSKRIYVSEHIDDIEYRTVAFSTEKEAIECENKIEKLNIHKFNT